MIIEIYDGDPDDITEGQLFKASVKTDKNRTIVRLVSKKSNQIVKRLSHETDTR